MNDELFRPELTRILLSVALTGYGSLWFQWNLVCDREYLKDLSQTILAAGVMIGAMVFTIVADRFGRKPALMFSEMAMVVVGVATALVPNYYAFLVLRFLTGLLQQVGT